VIPYYILRFHSNCIFIFSHLFASIRIYCRIHAYPVFIYTYIYMKMYMSASHDHVNTYLQIVIYIQVPLSRSQPYGARRCRNTSAREPAPVTPASLNDRRTLSGYKNNLLSNNNATNIQLKSLLGGECSTGRRVRSLP